MKNKIAKLTGETIGASIGGLAIGVIYGAGLGSIFKMLTVLVLTISLLLAFIEIESKKQNYIKWVKQNLIILFGVSIGLGGLTSSLFFNETSTLFHFIVVFFFTPMVAYIARKGE